MEINQAGPALNTDYQSQSVYVRSSGKNSSAQSIAVDLAAVTGNQPGTPEPSGTLNEIQAGMPAVQSGLSGDSQNAVLKDDSGSGNVSVNIASSLYVLNHSFDEQKGILNLIA